MKTMVVDSNCISEIFDEAKLLYAVWQSLIDKRAIWLIGGEGYLDELSSASVEVISEAKNNGYIEYIPEAKNPEINILAEDLKASFSGYDDYHIVSFCRVCRAMYLCTHDNGCMRLLKDSQVGTRRSLTKIVTSQTASIRKYTRDSR